MTDKKLDAEGFEEDIFGEDSTDGNEIAKALSNLIKQLADGDNIDYYTDLSTREIRHISVLSIREDKTTQSFLDKYKSLQVSRRRKGRKELIEGVKAIGSVAKNEEEKGLKDRIGASLR